jgi:hypothetical protein
MPLSGAGSFGRPGHGVKPGPSGVVSLRATGHGEDEDENLERVGGLARGKPIVLFTETLRHRPVVASAPIVLKCVRGGSQTASRDRTGEHPRGVKTQERIGSNRLG